MAFEYPTTRVSNKLKKFLCEIPTRGKPQKLTKRELEARGYTSNYDTSIITVLEFIGFLNSDKEPTDLYDRFRDESKQGAVMASALRKAYAELFNAYPNAASCEISDLKAFFAAHTGAAERTQRDMASAFLALCEFADFEVSSEDTASEEHTEESHSVRHNTDHPEPLNHGAAAQPNARLSPAVQINISLTIPETTDPDVYREFFKAMREYIMDISGDGV